MGLARVKFTDNHIKVDKRISWFLHRLDNTYGDNTVYVHLVRNRNAVAKIFNNWWKGRTTLTRAYAESILMHKDQSIDICSDLVDSVTENIELFLKDKQKITVNMDDVRNEFSRLY